MRDAGKATLVVASPGAESRRRWSQTLQESYAVCEVAERRALDQVTANLRPDVLVLDLTLPRLGRIRGLAHIREVSPATKTLVLTDTPSDSEGICALKAGARAYYLRTIEPPHLRKAVEAVRRGEIWVQRRLVPGLVAELISLSETREQDRHGRSEGHLDTLTLRQRTIAEMIGKGASNKEIATRLSITERTVKAHLTETFRTLGVADRLRLALLLNGHAPQPR